MKNTLIYLFTISMFIIGCEDKKVEEEEIIDLSVKEFKSVNIKDNGSEFFTFADNKGTTIEPSVWDLSFSVIEYKPSPLAPTIKDPVIVIGSGKKAAKVEAISIGEANIIPDGVEFKTDENGYHNTQGWYDYDGITHVMTPKDVVYVIDVGDNLYALVEILDYYDDYGKSGVFTIHWKYLEKQ